MNYQKYQHVDSERQESPTNLTQECETYERQRERELFVDSEEEWIK